MSIFVWGYIAAKCGTNHVLIAHSHKKLVFGQIFQQEIVKSALKVGANRLQVVNDQPSERYIN
ncbi:unnamed protein product [Ceratitis capitata]|uniref:(Mediterranean fruit fly) hypothetical protein n=1 Tax=Ceratitis capitata TaxID=7213 RepID=A0A811V1D2_CERCA|nr:unnamed protein product [Ceratitis capitata]